MKPIYCLLLLTLLITGCTTLDNRTFDFQLLPFPKELTASGISSWTPEEIQTYYLPNSEKSTSLVFPFQSAPNPKSAQIILEIDTTLRVNPEGYYLSISNQAINIRGWNTTGLFYGLITLKQIVEDANEQGLNLPLCEIEDSPALAFRAIHLDLKHHLEKTEYYYALIDELAQYKINGIIAELEDKLGYQRRPAVASSDALSIEEWQKLSRYAKARNIEISPLIQGLGHASFILKHQQYEHLRDNPKSDWAFNPLLPETYEVQFDLYRDAIEATPNGRYLHIGGDEVHTTGGNSGQSPLELQLHWLNKVCAFAQAHNRTPIFWDDMPIKHANVYRQMFNPAISQDSIEKVWAENDHHLTNVLDQFPKNCIYMRWNYSSPQTYGNRKAMQWFTQNGLQVMGATAGQTRWVLMPQKESNFAAIRAFADISIENKAEGLLLTLWDDDSPHFELYKRGIAFFAECTWTGNQRTKAELKRSYRSRAFGHRFSTDDFAFIDSLETAAAFWKNAVLLGNKRNYIRSETNAEDSFISLPEKDTPGEWTQSNLDRLETANQIVHLNERIRSTIEAIKTQSDKNKFRLEIYAQVNKMARYTPELLTALQRFDLAEDDTQRQLAQEGILQLVDSFATLRQDFENTYGQTRLLHKPKDYILDQDHHHHLANQSINFDWQFLAETKFIEQLRHRFNASKPIKD